MFISNLICFLISGYSTGKTDTFPLFLPYVSFSFCNLLPGGVPFYFFPILSLTLFSHSFLSLFSLTLFCHSFPCLYPLTLFSYSFFSFFSFFSPFSLIFLFAGLCVAPRDCCGLLQFRGQKSFIHPQSGSMASVVREAMRQKCHHLRLCIPCFSCMLPSFSIPYSLLLDVIFSSFFFLSSFLLSSLYSPSFSQLFFISPPSSLAHMTSSLLSPLSFLLLYLTHCSLLPLPTGRLRQTGTIFLRLTTARNSS